VETVKNVMENLSGPYIEDENLVGIYLVEESSVITMV